MSGDPYPKTPEDVLSLLRETQEENRLLRSQLYGEQKISADLRGQISYLKARIQTGNELLQHLKDDIENWEP
jgi:hypothetical protein